MKYVTVIVSEEKPNAPGKGFYSIVAKVGAEGQDKDMTWPDVRKSLAEAVRATERRIAIEEKKQ